MAIGSGLAGSLGLKAEATYGTGVTPDRFLEVNSVSLKKDKNVAQGGGLRAGTFFQPGSRRVVTTSGASGSIELEVVNKQMGLLLQAQMGTTVTPVVQGATSAYLQTHTFADTLGKSFTAQVGVPDLTGTVRPYTYSGCKVMGAEFSCGVNDILTATFDVDAQSVTDATGLAAPSYLTGLSPFHFGQMAVKVGTFGSEASVSGVSKVSVKIERNQKADRFYAGANGLKAEPVVAGWQAITGTIDTDFVDKTVFADRFASDSSFSLVWEFVGATIASTFKETFRITLPSCFLDSDTPTLDGPDVVSPSFGFTYQYDGTNLPKIEYMSAEVAI